MCSMRFKVYESARDFLNETRAFLDKHPAANQLIVANALQVLDSNEKNDAYFAAVWEKDALTLAVVRTPPHNLLLSYLGEDSVAPEALRLVIGDVSANHASLPGVLGPPAAAEAFAESYASETRRGFQKHREMGIHELTAVVPPKPCAGAFRPAGDEDEELVLNWIVAFNKDIGTPCEKSKLRESVAKRLAARDFHLWEDGRMVSIAAKARPTDRGVFVNNVYTPPEFRNRGYASACVAALSQKLLDSGYAYCSLYTDLANPTSNHIYRTIGYRAVCDAVEFEFRER